MQCLSNIFLELEHVAGKCITYPGPVTEAQFLQNKNLSAGVPMKAEPATKA